VCRNAQRRPPWPFDIVCRVWAAVQQGKRPNRVLAVMYINNSGLGRGDSHHTTARLLRKRSRWHILGLANRPPMTVGPLCTSSVCAVSSTRECMVVACTWLNSSSRKRFERTGITGVRCFVSRRPSDCKCCHTEPHCKTRVLSRPGCSS